MGKTRDLIKKIRYQGNISCKDGLNKGQKQYGSNRGRRDGKNTQNYHILNNHDGVDTHLELDILKCEVKWALGSITTNKVSGGDGIPAELFQVLKDDAVKVLHSICANVGKSSSGHRTGKGHSNPKERAIQKNVQTTTQLQGSKYIICT